MTGTADPAPRGNLGDGTSVGFEAEFVRAGMTRANNAGLLTFARGSGRREVVVALGAPTPGRFVWRRKLFA